MVVEDQRRHDARAPLQYCSRLTPKTINSSPRNSLIVELLSRLTANRNIYIYVLSRPATGRRRRRRDCCLLSHFHKGSLVATSYVHVPNPTHSLYYGSRKCAGFAMPETRVLTKKDFNTKYIFRVILSCLFSSMWIKKKKKMRICSSSSSIFQKIFFLPSCESPYLRSGTNADKVWSSHLRVRITTDVRSHFTWIRKTWEDVAKSEISVRRDDFEKDP